MSTETESVRIRTDVLDKLRETLAKKHKGRLYGKIGESIEIAIEEWINKQDGLDDLINYKLVVNRIRRIIDNME